MAFNDGPAGPSTAAFSAMFRAQTQDINQLVAVMNALAATMKQVDFALSSITQPMQNLAAVTGGLHDSIKSVNEAMAGYPGFALNVYNTQLKQISATQQVAQAHALAALQQQNVVNAMKDYGANSPQYGQAVAQQKANILALNFAQANLGESIVNTKTAQQDWTYRVAENATPLLNMGANVLRLIGSFASLKIAMSALSRVGSFGGIFGGGVGGSLSGLARMLGPSVGDIGASAAGGAGAMGAAASVMDLPFGMFLPARQIGQNAANPNSNINQMMDGMRGATKSAGGQLTTFSRVLQNNASGLFGNLTAGIKNVTDDFTQTITKAAKNMLNQIENTPAISQFTNDITSFQSDVAKGIAGIVGSSDSGTGIMGALGGISSALSGISLPSVGSIEKSITGITSQLGTDVNNTVNLVQNIFGPSGLDIFGSLKIPSLQSINKGITGIMNQLGSDATNTINQVEGIFGSSGLNIFGSLSIPTPTQIFKEITAIVNQLGQDAMNIISTVEDIFGLKGLDIFPSISIPTPQQIANEITSIIDQLGQDAMNLIGDVKTLFGPSGLDFLASLIPKIPSPQEIANDIGGLISIIENDINTVVTDVANWLNGIGNEIQGALRYLANLVGFGSSGPYGGTGIHGGIGIPGYASGGVIPAGGPAILHPGEWVIPSSLTAFLMNSLSNVTAGGGNGGVNLNPNININITMSGNSPVDINQMTKQIRNEIRQELITLIKSAKGGVLSGV